MKIVNRSGVGRRSLSKSLIGVGLGTALMLAGVTLVGVLPAAATAASLSFMSPTSPAPANAAENYTVAFTAAASGDTITLSSTNCTLSPSGSSLVYTTSGTSGNATFTGITLSGAGTGSCALVATDAPTGGTATATITVTPSTANKVVFTTEPASTTPANTAVPFTVKTEDTYGNLETASTDSVTITSSCTLGGATPVSEVGGVASFTTVTFNTVGPCYLTADDTTAVLPTQSSTLVTVTGGTPAKLAFTTAPPTTVAATGTVVTTFKVSVEDASGNVDTTGAGSTDVVSIASPCLAAAVPVTAIAGVATYSTVEFATTGACVLTATDTSRVIAAATASVQVGTPQAALVLSTTSGYLDAPITLATSGGSGTGAVTFTVANGTATGCTITSGVLTATTGGTCTVTATKAAVSPYASATVTATVTISSAPKALRVAGVVTKGKKSVITVTGYNFSGRPKLTSNVAGFKATVTRDTGKALTVTITVTGASKAGVKVLALAFANGKHASVKYNYRA